MAIAFRTLGWTPSVFWSATPRELACALGLGPRPDSLSRALFDQLARRHPDEDPGRPHEDKRLKGNLQETDHA